MKNFEYIKPSTVTLASELLKGEHTAACAGGTDLIDLMRNRILPEYPKRVVSLKGIEGLDYIREEHGSLLIGAMTTLNTIARSALVKEKNPMIAQAAESVASPNLRNTATIGGNLCQDVRCWYYRYPDSLGGRVNCARKEGHLCSAMMGENRYHSIFGAAKVCMTPCTQGCPAHTDISAYMEKLREGDVDEAARIILRANPMPAITSRVCAHFCQEKCNREQYDERVNVGAVERYVGDYILEHHERFMKAPKQENGKRAAIVGSGPAGLAAAYYLRESGYGVTVYERMKEAGGCLAYAIPAYRLPKEIVQKFVSVLEGMGVCFVFNTKVGEDIELETIRSENDSVLLDTGAWKRPLIGISGEELTRFGLDFLVEVNSYIHERPGSEVVVVGGGNVAAEDAAFLARGCEKVYLIHRRNELRAAQTLQQEVKELPNVEILWDTVVEAVEGNMVTESLLIKNVKTGEEKHLPVNGVFAAVGIHPDSELLQELAERDEQGYVIAGEDGRTSRPGIFVAGDIRKKKMRQIITAAAAGANAVNSVEEYLRTLKA